MTPPTRDLRSFRIYHQLPSAMASGAGGFLGVPTPVPVRAGERNVINGPCKPCQQPECGVRHLQVRGMKPCGTVLWSIQCQQPHPQANFRVQPRLRRVPVNLNCVCRCAHDMLYGNRCQRTPRILCNWSDNRQLGLPCNTSCTTATLAMSRPPTMLIGCKKTFAPSSALCSARNRLIAGT